MNKEDSVSLSGTPWPKIKVSAGLCSSGGSGGRILFMFLFQLLESSCISWLIASSFFVKKLNFYFILTYSWFTMLYWFQVNSKVIQLSIYIQSIFFRCFPHIYCCVSASKLCSNLCDFGLQHARLPVPTISQSLPEFMSIEMMMLSNHLIFWEGSPALSLSQHQGLFQGVGSLHQVAKVLELHVQC